LVNCQSDCQYWGTCYFQILQFPERQSFCNVELHRVWKPGSSVGNSVAYRFVFPYFPGNELYHWGVSGASESGTTLWYLRIICNVLSPVGCRANWTPAESPAPVLRKALFRIPQGGWRTETNAMGPLYEAGNCRPLSYLCKCRL